MNKITSFAVTVLLFAATGTTAFTQALDVQSALLGSSAENVQVKANINLDISLPDFPTVEPVNFQNNTTITFAKGDHNILILSEQLPSLYTEVEDIPESFKPLAIEMKITSSTVKIEWDDEKNIKISPVDLNVNVTETNDLFVNFTMKNVVFEVADLNENSVDLNFTSTLSTSKSELFNQIFSGKKIVGKMSIAFLK